MKVRFKRLHPAAVTPTYAKHGDAGLDITAVRIIKQDKEQITYGTWLSFEIPKGYVGLLYPRSSIRKYQIQMVNSVGVIDSGYRGEVEVTFSLLKGQGSISYSVGERVAQLIIMPFPTIKLVESDDLSSTERGAGGFGSTGT